MKWVSKPTFLLYTGFEKMGATEEKLFSIVEPLCDEEKIFLEDVSVHGGGRDRLIKIIVDTESGITLAQCQELSKKISDIFYRKDIFNGDYRIEVSSPGADKPLEKSYEYRRSIGKDIIVNYHAEGEIKSVTGQLLAFEGDTITLQQKKENISVPISEIEEAKIKFKW
jgi:ribosome maturation factor RimP